MATEESKIEKIFSQPDVKHGLSLFTKQEIAHVDKLIAKQDHTFVIKCQIKDRYKVAKPEEIVRQLWISRLIAEYGYPKERLDVERVVYFGSRVEPGASDIVVLHEDRHHLYMLFEIKRPSRTAGLDQLKSYCNAEGAPIGVWSNGNEMIRLHREEPNIFVEIPRIPKAFESLRDILKERWTLQWLQEHDELSQGKTTLKKILLDLEELVLGNSGVDPFEEIFKLIYAKLYDEWKGINKADYQLEFFVGDRSPDQVKRAITNLLEGAKRTWPGVFELPDKVQLKDDHLKVCVSFLEKIKLFNSNLQIIDEAFEYLIPQVSKKKEGQFFTPRPVVDMVVKMLNPKADEYVIDPACGSAGFLLHSVMWVAGGSITGRELPAAAKNFAQNNIFGIDFASKVIKIAKATNLIVGDGKSHVYKDNSLTSQTWTDETKAGLRQRLLRFANEPEKDRANQESFRYFDFDVLMTNPPFAGTVKERDILRLYQLAERHGKLASKVGRHILFLERSLQQLRPRGRMAIVLPQGLLNNPSAENIRRFILEEGRILAVVGLHRNTFKPHTGTKTSIVFIQKLAEMERLKALETRARYETEWAAFIKDISDRHGKTNWKSSIVDKDVPSSLLAFVGSYFGSTSETEEDIEGETSEERQSSGEDAEEDLSEKLRENQGILKEKRDELSKSSEGERRRELKRELRLLESLIAKQELHLSEKTLGGQIWLTFQVKKIQEEFKAFWIEEKVARDLDYPIFFAVNQKPLKDESGEYRYLRTPTGEFVTDKYGHPSVDHDLDDIAEAFLTFAKKERLDFRTA